MFLGAGSFLLFLKFILNLSQLHLWHACPMLYLDFEGYHYKNDKI
jgi:hypothetical protein